MRILYLLKYPLFGSGSGTYARKLAEIVAKQYPDDKIALFCPDKKNKIQNIKYYYYDISVKAVATGHPDWPDAKIFSQLSAEEIDQTYINALSQVIKVIHDFKPDVIHVHHELYFTWIANYIRAIYGIYYIVTVHGTDLLTASADKRWIPLTKDGLSRAWVINAVSGDTKKWLIKVYGRSLLRNVRIISGGIDLLAYPTDLKIKIIDQKYNLKNKKVVIFVGKLEEHKGVQYLLKAASKIKAEIFIMGSGTYQKNLESLANDLKLTNVHFLGYFGSDYIQELREFYKRASVFVFPSIWDEPLGLVALEAMASCTPVVASKKGGIPLAVKDGVNGFLVRARSSKEIACKVNKILDNPELGKRLGYEARKIVESRFDWNILAKRFHSYYEQAYKDSQIRLKRMKLPIDIKREHQEIKGKKISHI